jgi:translation initiation factor 2B subunit (eIF-2B alpha/beta/delta family)
VSADLEAGLAKILSDGESGADDLGAAAAHLLAEAASSLSGPDLEAFALRVRDARPAMATIANAAHAVLRALAEGSDPAAAARAWGDGLREKTLRAARFAAAHLSGRGRVVTLSWSATVAEALRLVDPDARPEAVVCESRPALEGRKTARSLAESGYRVSLATEAGAGSRLEAGTVVLLGADSLHADGGFTNKAGSFLLAAGARETGAEVVVVASTSKCRFGPGWEEESDAFDPEPGDGSGLWNEPPPGVSLLDPTFERVPGRLVSFIATEWGLLLPGVLVEEVRGPG